MADTEERILVPKQAAGLVQSVGLVVSDEISGGCWRNVALVTQKARNILEQAGISVYLKEIVTLEPAVVELIINGSGYRIGGNCVGAVAIRTEASLFRDYTSIIKLDRAVNFEQNIILFDSENTLDEPILEFVESVVLEFVNDAISAQRDEIVANTKKSLGKVKVHLRPTNR